MNTLEAQMLLRYAGLSYRDEASSDDWARVLQTFPLFSGIGRRRLRKLVQQATLAEFVPAETVLSPDERNDSIYVVLGGTARARREAGAQTLRVGDHFGDLSRSEDGPREATVVAVDYLHVMRLPRGSFHRHTQHVPPVSVARLRSLAKRFRPLETRPVRC